LHERVPVHAADHSLGLPHARRRVLGRSQGQHAAGFDRRRLEAAHGPRDYVLGGTEQVPDTLVSLLQPYGAVTRLTNDDAVAFNTPPPITAESTAVAFSQMWDPVGMVGG